MYVNIDIVYEKTLLLYNLKAKTRSENFVQKYEIIIDRKRIYAKNEKNVTLSFEVQTVSWKSAYNMYMYV